MSELPLPPPFGPEDDDDDLPDFLRLGGDGETESAHAGPPPDTDPLRHHGSSVEDVHALHEHLRGRLQETVVGHDAVVDRLALAGVQHVLGRSGQRLLLVGAPGSGKTTIARALASALELPWVMIDVSQMAETNWRGVTLPDVLGGLYRTAGCSVAEMRRAVIILDELDKVSLRGTRDSGRDYRRGKQESLLGLLGGGRTSLNIGGAPATVSWSADRALILSAGAFTWLPPDARVTPELLVRRGGFTPELVERLGEILPLEPLCGAPLRRILWQGIADVMEVFSRYGYRLQIAPEALAYAASRVDRRHFGPRSAITSLRAAANRGLPAPRWSS